MIPRVNQRRLTIKTQHGLQIKQIKQKRTAPSSGRRQSPKAATTGSLPKVPGPDRVTGHKFIHDVFSAKASHSQDHYKDRGFRLTFRFCSVCTCAIIYCIHLFFFAASPPRRKKSDSPKISRTV